VLTAFVELDLTRITDSN